MAQTSTLVVIALESPGSIAELGSFSVNSALKNKIIIVLSEHHHNQNSFIKLGPLRQLTSDNVYSYPYNHETPTDTLTTEYLDDIVENITSTLSRSVKTEKFDLENNGHVALLIYELISTFHALKLKEINHYLGVLGIDRQTSDVKRLLFLLMKLALVSQRRMGNVDFYVPSKHEQRMRFASNNDQRPFDRNAASIGTAAYYKSTSKERMRKRVIAAGSDSA